MGVDWGALGALWESTGVLWGPFGSRLGCSGGPMGVNWGSWRLLGALISSALCVKVRFDRNSVAPTAVLKELEGVATDMNSK